MTTKRKPDEGLIMQESQLAGLVTREFTKNTPESKEKFINDFEFNELLRYCEDEKNPIQKLNRQIKEKEEEIASLKRVR